MLGCNIGGYTRACSTVTGGCDLLLVGDANDFDFTSGTPGSDGNPVGYSAVTRRAGATALGGAYFYEIQSVEDTIGVDITQANGDGSSSSYDYLIAARQAKLSQALTNFNVKIDAAAACCQLVFIYRTNDGTIFVAGEKYVDGARIVKFKLRQDGSKMQTGKKFTEFNGQDLSIKGSYNRAPFEFVGGISAITAFQAP